MTKTRTDYKATLKYGESYTIGGTVFLRGKPQVISEAMKNKLEASAIDRLTLIEGEGEKSLVKRQKFVFQAVEAQPGVETKAERFAGMAAMAEAQGDAEFDEDDGSDDEGESDTGDFEDAESEEAAGEEEAEPEPQKPVRGGRGKRGR